MKKLNRLSSTKVIRISVYIFALASIIFVFIPKIYYWSSGGICDGCQIKSTECTCLGWKIKQEFLRTDYLSAKCAGLVINCKTSSSVVDLN